MYQINCDLRKWTFMTSDGRERLTRNKIKKKGTAQGGGGGGHYMYLRTEDRAIIRSHKLVNDKSSIVQ